MNKANKLILAAGLALALAFTLSSCLIDISGNDDEQQFSSSSGKSSSSRTIDGGTFADSRDGKTYRWVGIGTQIWMAENLNYNIAGSRCYDKDPENCTKYGRLYDWATAMSLESICNHMYCKSQVNAKHKGICPTGWHIPSNAEWDALFHAADGTSDTDTESPYSSITAGKYLKATNGWNDCGMPGSGNSYFCEDIYGFAALSGGSGYSNDDPLHGDYFDSVGDLGYWWSASEEGLKSAYYYGMLSFFDYGLWNKRDKIALHSIRCVQD